MPSLATNDPVLVEVTRSGRVESRHRGAVAVVHGDDVLLALGDVETEVCCRSAVKPLQALPFLERGLHERFGLSDGEIAVMAASHQGTAAHVAAVRSLLEKGGLSEDALGCGPHAPYDTEARKELLRQGREPLRVHNNCSGKHSGFVLLARELGDDLGQYLDPCSRGQQEVHAAVAAMAGVEGPLPLGVDGCGAPTFWLGLRALARAFARLANPDGLDTVRADACRRLLEAARREPVLLSGAGRLCAALLRALPCAAFPKNGAEGVYALALAPDRGRTRCPGGVGIAIKVEDGNARGYLPVVVDLLAQLGAFGGGEVPATLRGWRPMPLCNTRGATVGEVRCAVDWSMAR